MVQASLVHVGCEVRRELNDLDASRGQVHEWCVRLLPLRLALAPANQEERQRREEKNAWGEANRLGG